MLLVNSTMFKKPQSSKLAIAAVLLVFTVSFEAAAQDNSPLSRFGLGDQTSKTPTTNRGMGGISAAYNDYLSVNYSNPASYAFFQAMQEINSRKLLSGRAVLDVGLDAEFRSLIDPKNTKGRFTSSNILFSHVMLGVPLRKNWGLALGLRPVNRISYKMSKYGPLTDPNTNAFIDSAQTLNEGSGGAYLATIGTGVKVKIKENSFLSFGINGGYMFGKKDYTTRVIPFSNTTLYTNGFQQNKTSFGNFYFDAGMQYQFKLKNNIYMGIGAYGNWEQKMRANREYLTGTYTYSTDVGYSAIDTSVYTPTKGTIILPTSYTAGFIIQKALIPGKNEAGWLVGADFTKSNWDNYRYYGAKDPNIVSNWNLKMGAEFRPVPKNAYFSNVAYRLGFRTGPDYIMVNNNSLPTLGFSIGAGLPLRNYNFQATTQATLINLAFEYEKRGNNNTTLKDNLYRVSVGFSLTDLWFVKRRYR